MIGGSPCTYWSIAQTKNREVKAEGIGWELFKNYLIAKEKFKPDFYLYENNKSAAKAIKNQISVELGVDLMYINSALVSAQNRQRFYAFNWMVEQPQDRGIMLADILESGIAFRDKAYALDANYYKGTGYDINFEKQSGKRGMVAEPVGVGYRNRREADGKLYRRFETSGVPKANALTTVPTDSMVAEPLNEAPFVCSPPVIFQNPHGFNKGGIKYDKAPTLTATGRYTSNNFVIEAVQNSAPIRIGTIENTAKSKDYESKQYRVYSPYGKATTLCGNGGGIGAKTGLYACPVNALDSGKARCLTAGYSNKGVQHILDSDYSDSPHKQTWDCVACPVDTPQLDKDYKVYTVENGLISIKGKQYPIALADGKYIIRKLTVTECCRLQTLPDDYCRAVSNTQAYKGLGNGWTAEAIIHILNGALKDVPRDEEIVCLSMYDGIGTGRYCLAKMGFKNVKYYAYEIDKYAMKVASSNFPDIIQCGDAFKLRNDDWAIGR